MTDQNKKNKKQKNPMNYFFGLLLGVLSVIIIVIVYSIGIEFGEDFGSIRRIELEGEGSHEYIDKYKDELNDVSDIEYIESDIESLYIYSRDELEDIFAISTVELENVEVSVSDIEGYSVYEWEVEAYYLIGLVFIFHLVMSFVFLRKYEVSERLYLGFLHFVFALFPVSLISLLGIWFENLGWEINNFSIQMLSVYFFFLTLLNVYVMTRVNVALREKSEVEWSFMFRDLKKSFYGDISLLLKNLVIFALLMFPLLYVVDYRVEVMMGFLVLCIYHTVYFYWINVNSSR